MALQRRIGIQMRTEFVVGTVSRSSRPSCLSAASTVALKSAFMARSSAVAEMAELRAVGEPQPLRARAPSAEEPAVAVPQAVVDARCEKTHSMATELGAARLLVDEFVDRMPLDHRSC